MKNNPNFFQRLGLFFTPFAGLFLWGLGFEKIVKTKGIFKIKERFQVLLE